MSDQKPPVILVDGSSYLYRAFHQPQLQRLSTSKGRPTGAIFGVISMLKKLRDAYDPEYMAVVFDAKGKTFRHDLYEEYKANRPPMPDELKSQIEPLHALVKAMGFPLICVDGVEADDVIGTLSTVLSKKQRDVLVSTGDKDLAQLVNERITLINTMSDTLMDERGVAAKFEVTPAQIIDYLTLIGDTSDNIPGVPKVGPRTAVKWLSEYGSLDEIIRHADEIKGKVGENLRASLDQLALSRELVTIRHDLDLGIGLGDLALKPGDNEALQKLYIELEFRSWLDELGGSGEPEAGAGSDGTYETVLDQHRFDAWVKQLKKAKRFAFDTETTSLNYMKARVVGVSFAIEPGAAAYVPFGHDYPGAPEQLAGDTVLGALKPLLENPKLAKIGQNLKYDAHVLANHGIDMQGIAEDTMLESYVLDSTQRHDMDSMALRLLGQRTVHFEDIAGKGAKQLTFNQVDLQQAGPYAAEDADITLQIHNVLSGDLKANKQLDKVYREIELPLLPVLLRIERNGVKVDVDMLKRHSKELTKRIAGIEQQAFEVAGESFNLASPKQLQTILFDRIGLKPKRKTPKGQPSTAEDVLQEYADEGEELPRLILEHRGMSKLKSTYTDKLPQMVNDRTGRLHTSYNQTVAATGRLSSTDPNLQNIPIRSEEGRRIRQAFVAGKGNCLLAADYSQIELRIMAHLSQDDSLLTAFSEGKDIHRSTAAEVFGIDEDAVESEQRRAAKAINFGLIYGMSAFGLARQLGIGRLEAQDYVNRYFERYPGVKDYMDRTRAQAHEDGFVETVFGRRLYLPEINARNAQRRQYAERTAINAPMQGTAADIIKRAMIAVDQALQKSRLSARVVMQVHDELVLEVAKPETDKLSELVREHMQSAADLSVQLVVEIGIGANWDEAH